MKILIFTIASGFIFSIFFIVIFKKTKLVNLNPCCQTVPYAGGTILLFTIIFSLSIYYVHNMVSFFKYLFFSLCLFCVYFLGFIEDLYNTSKKIRLKGSLKKSFNIESLVYLIKTFSIALVTFYIFYIFNDDFWLYKVIITLLFINFFNSLGNHPGRSLKVYYPLMLILNLTILQWTNELLTASIIAASVYYFFDAFSYSMLGSSGLYILGLVSGLIYSEALGVNIYLYIFSIILLLAACLILNIKFLSNKFGSNSFFKYFDSLLTAGENNTNSISMRTQLESHKTNIEQDSAIHPE